jgi:hypothetical protein
VPIAEPGSGLFRCSFQQNSKMLSKEKQDPKFNLR